MSWLHGVAHRVRTIVNPRAYERDLADEMRLHVELDALQQRDRDRARRRFGNATYYTEEARNTTWLGALDVLQQDARFAWRSIKRNPGLTALIVVTFTLGIGVNAATFTLLDRIYLRPPVGVANPGDVHRIWFRMRTEGGMSYVPAMSFPMFPVIREAWGDSNHVALALSPPSYTIGGTHRGAKVDALFATANYFPVLGVRPQLGRFYAPDEDRLGSGAPVVVLSNHLWRSQFGADSGVIGKVLKLDTDRYTIIGVAPRGFIGDDALRPVDVWIPMASLPQPRWMKEPFWESNSMYVYQALARARHGMDLGAFERRASRAIQQFNRAGGRDTLMTVGTGSIIYARGPGEQRQAHLLSTRLSAVAIIILIIAAANVANLLLARASRRRREIAVRLALGVGRWRLVRMLTAETLLLAVIAAAAAILAAWWGGVALRTLLMPDVRFIDSAIDARVVGFTLAIALSAGLIAGVVPALQASNPELTSALKEGARDGSVHRSRLRSALVVTQAALSVVLLAGAALFVQSLRNVRGVDIGYDAPGILIGDVDFDAGQAPPLKFQASQIDQVARRLDGRPGVLGVARATQVPMWGFSVTSLWIDSAGTRAFLTTNPVVNPVTANFFAATGLKLLRGRVFQDVRGAPASVVVNDVMARQTWPGSEPIGQCLWFQKAGGTCYSVVGIVETSRRNEILEDPKPQYYVPMSNLPKSLEDWSFGQVLLVRAAPAFRDRLKIEVQRELARTFPTGYPRTRMMTEIIDRQYRPWRVGAALFTGFGVLALIVAVVGIYSTVSYGVSQRTHEFGVRIALGARIADVLRLVVGEGLRTVAIGVLLGIALAVAAGRLVASLLYGIGPNDPIVMATVSLVLLFVAAAATLIPAWRAGKVDPMTALRAD